MSYMYIKIYSFCATRVYISGGNLVAQTYFGESVKGGNTFVWGEC